MQKLRHPLVIFALGAIIVALLWPRLSKNDKFPYVGTWQGDTVVAPGYGSKISFKADGSCTYIFTSPSGDQPQSCKYEMRGSKAYVTNVMIQEKKPLVFHVTVRPQHNGKTLLFNAVDVTLFDAKGQKTSYKRFTDPPYILRKVK